VCALSRRHIVVSRSVRVEPLSAPRPSVCASRVRLLGRRRVRSPPANRYGRCTARQTHPPLHPQCKLCHQTEMQCNLLISTETTLRNVRNFIFLGSLVSKSLFVKSYLRIFFSGFSLWQENVEIILFKKIIL
jgi:hypothetical protein